MKENPTHRDHSSQKKNINDFLLCVARYESFFIILNDQKYAKNNIIMCLPVPRLKEKEKENMMQMFRFARLLCKCLLAIVQVHRLSLCIFVTLLRVMLGWHARKIDLPPNNEDSLHSHDKTHLFLSEEQESLPLPGALGVQKKFFFR